MGKRAKKADLWMPLFVGDYIADTGHLTTEQHGAYLLLLMHQWRTGPLPDDARLLARIARMTLSAWNRRCHATVTALFTSTPEGLVQKRLAAERAHTSRISDSRTQIGRQGGLASKINREAQGADLEINAQESGAANGVANGQQSAGIHKHIDSDSSLRSESARPAAGAPERAPVQQALVLPITGGGDPIPADEPLGERVRREQGGEARLLLRRLAPALAPERMGELLGAWCKHLHGDRAVLLHVLRDAERHAAHERIVGDPIRWLWGLVRQRASASNTGAPHDRFDRPAERRTYGEGGSDASRRAVLAAISGMD